MVIPGCSGLISSMISSQFVAPGDQIEIHLPDSRTLRGPRGATAESLLQPIVAELPAPLVGVVVNGELCELTHPIDMEARVRPVTMADADGARIYRRSLTFLLEAAFRHLFPEALLLIDHSLASGGYFCNVRGRGPFTPDELKGLEAEMRRLVAQDLPFCWRDAPVEEAIAYFESRHDLDKARLIAPPPQAHHHALPPRRLRRLSPRLHGAFHRVPAVVRTRGDGRRLCAPLSAPAYADQARADGRLPEAARRVPPVWRLARAAGHLERGRARRRHQGGPQPRDHPGFGGPARTAHRGDRPPDRRPPASRRGWC